MPTDAPRPDPPPRADHRPGRAPTDAPRTHGSRAEPTRRGRRDSSGPTRRAEDARCSPNRTQHDRTPSRQYAGSPPHRPPPPSPTTTQRRRPQAPHRNGRPHAVAQTVRRRVGSHPDALLRLRYRCTRQGTPRLRRSPTPHNPREPSRSHLGRAEKQAISITYIRDRPIHNREHLRGQVLTDAIPRAQVLSDPHTAAFALGPNRHPPRTRTPTACYVSTSPKAPISLAMTSANSMQSLTSSTDDLDEPSAG